MSTDPTLVPPGTLPTTFIPTTSAGNVGYMVMSYPGRPQMVPGIHMPPGMGMPYMQLGAPPPLMPGVPMQMGHMMGAPPLAAPMVPRPYRPSPVTTSAPPRPKTVPPVRYLPPQPDGPAVTLFIGNIAEKAPDQMVRFILSACGHVTSWKRVQGFGFCEFGNPDAGLRAIRLLHNYEIGGKKLVVRVDAKAKSVLEDYKNEKRKKSASSSPLQDENIDEHDYMDDDMKNSDKAALDRISMILNDYDNEMKNYVAPMVEETKPVQEPKLPTPTPQVKHHDGPSSVDLTDTHIDDDHRRELITREIGKFREFMKKQEEEKEVERKKREEKDREDKKRDRDRSPGGRGGSRARSPAHDRSSSPAESVSRHRSHKSNRHRTKSRSSSPAESISRHRSHKMNMHRTKSRSRERDREREKDRDTRERDRDSERGTRDRDREKERDSKSDRDLLREKEEEEEAKEKKKLDRKAKEKEVSYQERLRNWESRERHKVKESLKEKEKRRLKDEEREKEAKRLKEFLEDYDDERDDIKYYKGRELARRLEEREKEMETDAKDRQKEKEELAELKAKIFAGNCEDPNAEFAKAMKAREELYKPKILVNMSEEKKAPGEGKEKERGMKERLAAGGALGNLMVSGGVLGMVVEEEEGEIERKRPRHPPAPVPAPVAAPPSPDDSSRGASPAPPSPQSSPGQNSPEPPQEIIKSVSNKGYLSPSDRKKKKLDLKEVFNNDEDEESSMMNKKRKLVPLDYTDDKKKPNAKDMINPGIVKEVLHGKTNERETNQQHLPVQPPAVVPSKEEKKEEQAKSQEEKRKHIKSLIDRIPTDKAALFSYMLDWAAVDNQLMERRIRPWINKKIIEYIGEPEPTLVDFICSKVLAGSAPQGILDDVQMVLDEEAEVFVVKMWRLLIYEIEAKKLGLVK